MSLLQRGFRHLYGLPPQRFESDANTEWLAAEDGIRLATCVLRPIGAGDTPVVLIRTPLPIERSTYPTRLFARLLAEDGHAVVLQSCRGRYASEGTFEHFTHEARDGANTFDWIWQQPWGRKPLALVGFGYAGYAAWAALGHAQERVSALVVGFQGRDPHACLYSGGALRLEAALHLGVGIGERTLAPRGELDLARGCEHRPVCEADRVARRRVDSFRDWTMHPVRDDYWEAITPAIPESPPPTLLVGGWFDPTIEALLADYAELRDSTIRGRGAPPELVVGPWAGGGSAPDRRAHHLRAHHLLTGRARRERKNPLRSVLAFLARTLRGEGQPRVGVSVFVHGARQWRDSPDWPPPSTQERVFHLHGNGSANGFGGDGRLAPAEPAPDAARDHFTSDPEDPVRSTSALLRRAHGAAAGRSVEARNDVLCFTSERLDSDLEVQGAVRLVLFVSSGAPDGDFCAQLIDVAPDGTTTTRCEGIGRMRWAEGGPEPRWFDGDTPRCLTLALGNTASRFRVGHRVRLEIAGSNFPRFDRNPNTRDLPERADAGQFAVARPAVHHDAAHPSRLILRVAVDPASS